MKYAMEIRKIVEGALKQDQLKVLNYTKQLIEKLEEDDDMRIANKFSKILTSHEETALSVGGTNGKMRMPIDPESCMTLADVIYPDENQAQVILSKSNRDQLEAFILGYKNADKLNALGIGASHTLLLYGPLGCGKTKCAFWLAKELHLPLIVARLDGIMSSGLGATAKNIRTLFEFAKKTPCVLFLEEFDGLARARDDCNELGGLKRIVNSVLQNMDAMSGNSLLLAATNHENLLDPAIWRRFDYKVEIQLPDSEEIVQMIAVFTNGAGDFKAKDMQEFVAVFEGLSGADIEEIVQKALRNAALYDGDFTKSSVYEAFFGFKKIVPQHCVGEKDIQKIKARYLRECDEKIFSLQVIAEILGISKTTAAKLVKEDE